MIKEPTAAHRAFRDDVLALLNKHAGKLDAMEMLALGAHLVGQLVAMQDHRKVTPAMAMDLVGKNIEQGNGEVLAQLDHPAGSA